MCQTKSQFTRWLKLWFDGSLSRPLIAKQHFMIFMVFMVIPNN